MPQMTNPDVFITNCQGFRTSLQTMCLDLIAFKEQVGSTLATPGANRGEEMANLTLAFRHLEDAAMRIGKAIQAHTTGVSPLGGPNTPGTSQGASAGPVMSNATS